MENIGVADRGFCLARSFDGLLVKKGALSLQ